MWPGSSARTKYGFISVSNSIKTQVPEFSAFVTFSYAISKKIKIHCDIITTENPHQAFMV